MNIECDAATLSELEGIFRFNDAVLRHLTISRQEAIVEQSLMMKAKEEKDRSGRSYDERKEGESDDNAEPRADEKADEKAEQAAEPEPEAEPEAETEPKAPKVETAEVAEEAAAPVAEESNEDADAAKGADAS
jgi:small subunit ribosomal protein S6